MSRYYAMNIARLSDELDRLEEELQTVIEENPENYSARRNLENIIDNVCNLICRRECA